MPPPYPHTLYCLVAVFNRVETTRQFLDQLRRQRDVDLRVIVVDDGSTDGTADMLSAFQGLDLQVITSAGDLWWGGAMRRGMEFAFSQMRSADALILLNDDVEIDEFFLSRFCRRARELGPRVVIGCQQRDAESRQSASIGYKLNYFACRMDELTSTVDSGEICEVDALCGRGVLVSREVIEAVGFVDAKRFPHYLGDIEYSARAGDLGFRIVCDTNICVSTSFAVSDTKRVAKRPWRRFLSPTGSKNILQHYRFWSSRGPRILARTAWIRFPITKLSRIVTRG